MTNFKMIMFDMDGTLVDSFSFHAQVFQRFLKKFEVELELKQVEELIGNTLKFILDKTIPEEKHEEALKYLTDCYENHIDDLIEKLEVIDGAADLLKELRKLKIPVCLVTNSKKELVEKIISMKELSEYFDEIVATDNKSLDKSEGCQNLIRTYGVSSENVLYVGDSSHDIELCCKLNMNSCLIDNEISWLNKRNFNQKTQEPDFRLKSLKELTSILN